MSQKIHPEKIRQLLNRSLAQIEQPALERLREARVQALARYDARNTAPSFAWAGHSSRSGNSINLRHKSYYYWGGAILLAACLFSGAAYWQHATTEQDISEVDIAILTDDLPMHVYVD